MTCPRSQRRTRWPMRWPGGRCSGAGRLRAVISAAAEVCGRLLLGTDDVPVLATRREPLRVAGKVTVPARPADPARPGEPGEPTNREPQRNPRR